MHRGELWWAQLDDKAGRRPVVLLTRENAIPIRELVTIAPVSSRIRRLPVEVLVGTTEGLSRPSAINCDVIRTVRKEQLTERISLLPPHKIDELGDTIRFALGLDEGN